jgi:predicted amidohydrolase
MREPLRLGIVQMTSVDDVVINMDSIISLYQRAVGQGADLVVFPENALYMRLSPGNPMIGIGVDGEEMGVLVQLVEKYEVPLLLTTPVMGQNHYRNSTLLIEKGLPAREVYTKIHLFDADIEGAPSVRESEHFVHGAAPAVIEIEGWKIGLTICYDLRFSELYLHYAQKVDLILVPAAFLVPTGKAHWQVLLRARAIESQAFVAAPAQAGEHVARSGGRRKTYGHSLVVDPWGRILTELIDSPQVQIVSLSCAKIEMARAQIPMAQHRRLKSY